MLFRSTIADGRVVITPAESDELYCLDLLTGKPAWPAVRRDDHLFVGCVHDRKIVLVGKNKLTAIDLESGKPAWSKSVELPDGAITSGRGFFRDGSYFVPTTASQLVQVDVREGRIAAQIATDGVLGNLICYRDQVLSHGSQHLAAYFSIPSLRAEVAKRLDANRQDPWALARLAELQLHDGKRNEGLVTLREAQRLDPEDDAIRVLLVRTLLDLGAKIDEPASDGTTALFMAIVNAHWEMAAYLLNKGADPNAFGRGITPLQQLVVTRRLHEGHLPHPKPTGSMDSLELAKLLVAKGARINDRMSQTGMGDGYRNRLNRAGSTAFLLAAKGLDPVMMKLLVSLGADPKINTVEKIGRAHV